MINLKKRGERPNLDIDKIREKTDFNAAVPGESLTKKPGGLPFDRPPQHTDADEVLDRIFQRLMQPKVASQALALMEAGVPVEFLVEILVENLFGEGLVGAPTMFILVPSLTVMLTRMADAAGIEFKLSTDEGVDQDFNATMLRLRNLSTSSNKTERAVKAAKGSADQLKEMSNKGGLLSRPEGVI